LATVWEKSGQDFIFASNNEDLQHTILSKQLKIMLQCDYTRIRFYSPQYPSLIVTLDTNISFSKPDSHPKSFHFAVLEIKQTGTDPNQGIPLKGLETLLGKNESTILSHVPQFSKFVQGIYQMYSPLAAVPPWIDLAKERCWSPSLSLLRPSPTTSSTTTAVAQPDYTSIHISESECDSVHEDVKVEIRRTKPKRLIAYDQEGNPVYKKKRVKQDDTVLKVEPKVFFANERTFISWLQFCALLLTVALNLLNFGDLISRICGAIFLSIAVVLSLYALFRFQYRAKMLRNHQAQARYDDVYGPAVLCLLIVGALVINFWLRFHN
jgi:uncharacterized membrane protein YidH (DUF202 family)